ncbi:MAG: hypothetical protein ACRC2R_17925 [Xenococcaceae cyanobacterium]
MVFFISRSTRDTLGIDTIERSIVLSLLLLRNACTSESKSSKYYNAIKISTNVRGSGDTYQATFNATAKIPYQSNLALLEGMNLIRNLKEISEIRVTPQFTPLTPIKNAPPLPNEPNSLNTLEQYLVWSSQILINRLLPIVNVIKMNFFEDDPTEPSLIIECSLPIDWGKYMLTNNLIEATKLIANNDSNPNNPSNVLIGNQGLINNLALIGN